MSVSLDEIITDARDIIPDQLIIRKIGKHFFHGGHSKLYVVTPYWHATISQMPLQVLKRRILKAGYSCLIYQFPIKILSDNVHLTEKYFKEIEEEIRKDIKEIKAKYNFSEISFIGISLGGINALMAANGNKDVSEVFLIVPGDSLAESLWKGIGTQNLKNQIKKHRINLEELEKNWKDLEPKNNIDRLSEKHVEVYLSRSDTVIPYTNGHHLVKDMINKKINLKIYENKKLGHYLTILKFIFFKKF